MQQGDQRRQFPTTRWTLILSARQDPAATRAALDDLLAVYWKPLYFFARHRGLDAESAEDAVQDFVATCSSVTFSNGSTPSAGAFAPTCAPRSATS